MPSGRQRKHQILQRLKRQFDHARARKKALVLSEEVKKIEKESHEWRTRRRLSEIEAIHEMNLGEIIKKLKKRFPKEEIQVLDAGSGKSPLADELTQPGVRVFRSDNHPFELPDFHHVSTNHLLEHFGKNRFHFVIETWGGTLYGGSHRAALANIYGILKPGGMASIVALMLPSNDMPLFAKMAEEMGITHKRKKEALVIYK